MIKFVFKNLILEMIKRKSKKINQCILQFYCYDYKLETDEKRKKLNIIKRGYIL